MTAQSATTEALVRQLGLDDEGREMLDRVMKTQAKIDRKQAEIDALLAVRRADVLGLYGKYRVTKYRIAKILGVSQTTVGNVTRDHDEAGAG